MNQRAVAAWGAVAVLAAACGSPSSTAASQARTAASSASAPTLSPSPSSYVPTSTTRTLQLLPPASPPTADLVAEVKTITCTGSIGGSDAVAVVQLHSAGLVMRDYADPVHPRTVCQFPGMTYMPLLDAHHVLFSAPSYYYAVIQVPEVTATWFQLPATQFPELIAVSPNLDQIAYLTADQSNNTDQVHVVTAAGDAIVAVLPNPHGGRCGSPEDSQSGAYTHSGSALYVLDQPIPTLNSLVVVKDLRSSFQVVPQSSWTLGLQPAMAVWSPTSETLYYRYNGDVWKWTAAGGPQKFLPGVLWYYPTIAADGRHLAYAALRSDGLHSVYLVDLAGGGSPQLIGNGARNLPVFLNSTQLWYRSEAQGICGPGGNQPLVYDLGDGSESASIIDFVVSVWPSTSSNF